MYVQRKSLVSAVCACTVLLSFACGVLLDCQDTVLASGVDPVDGAQIISEFREEAEQRLVETQEAILTDIKNGNLNATSALGKEYLSAFAVQYIAVNNPAFGTLFHAADLVIQGIPTDYFVENPTVELSGKISSGYCYKSGDSNLHMVYCYYGSATICTSDFFNIYISPVDGSTTFSLPNSYTNDSYFGVFLSNSTYTSIKYQDSKQFFTGFTTGSAYYSCTCVMHYDPSSIPTLSGGSLNSYISVNSYNANPICGAGVTVILPTDTVDTSTPWDYFDVVNQYIEENFPDVPDNYYFFPDGYEPPPPATDPPEPTSPTGDFILPPYGELMTEPSSWYVTDESGETITDESGEPVTETTMIPVTVASSEEGRYVFRIPTLPNLEVPETPELSLSLPQKLVGLSAALFRGVYEILDSSGVLTILPFLVAVAVAIYVIYHIGG